MDVGYADRALQSGPRGGQPVTTQEAWQHLKCNQGRFGRGGEPIDDDENDASANQPQTATFALGGVRLAATAKSLFIYLFID